MWKISLNLLRYRHALQRPCSSLAKDVMEKFKLPEKVLPSTEFLINLSDEKQGKLARIIAELEAIYNVTNEVPKQLTEQNWEFMISHTFQIYDRQDYLRRVYQHEVVESINREENELRQRVLQAETERFERGELVYGRGFYEWCLVVGKDFRRLLNAYYGNQLRLHQQLDDDLPQFFVDCRFLHKLSQNCVHRTLADFQRLYEQNWTSKEPLPITFTNYLADNRISQVAKKLLHFLYGPPPKQNSADQAVEEGEYIPSAYAPRLTTRDFCSVLPPNVQKGEVAYITQVSNKVLDDETLKKSKLFVVHAFPEHVMLRSSRLTLLQELRESKIKAYRLPLDENVKCVASHKSFSASKTVAILRDMLTGKYEWKDVILKHSPPNSFVPLGEAGTKTDTERLQIYIRPSWDKDLTIKEYVNSQRSKRPAQLSNNKPKTRVHKYSREERQKMKQAATSS